MIVSLNWIKKFTDIDGTVDELVTRIGSRLVEIEGVEYIGDKYKDVVVARVVECAPVENSDHLNLTKIDDGGVVEGVERDDNGLVQVVCGAPNVHAGALVAWLPPKTVVPETFGDDEPFVLGSRELRGYMSNGMLASARELDLYDEHEGILLIDKAATPGDSFRDLYELDDYLLDIENKSLTHRPDAFGIIGFAREIAGIQGVPFKTPEWLLQERNVSADETAPRVEIMDQELSARFMAVVLENVNEQVASPIEIQTYLSRSGIRPISASVDISNYLMLLTGQPSHTYDYDKLLALAGDDSTIRVRTAREGEKLTLLDGREVTLDVSDIVIAAGEVAVGLAGAMGGQSTAVDSHTERVLLEVATFDLYHIRSTQMRHGIFSEAVTRFTKGVPAPIAEPVLVKAVELFQARTGALVSSMVADEYPERIAPKTVTVSESQVNGLLGTRFSAEDIAILLENVGFEVRFEDLVATIAVPYWREDIHIAEDVIEEVGRLAGFDTIDVTLLPREGVAVEPHAFDTMRTIIRHTLVRGGANEVLTYGFVHGDMLRSVGQDPENSYRIVNSISPDLQYYRQSLLPSLVGLVHANIRAGYTLFGLFEVNKVHEKADGLNDESVPVEKQRLGYVVASSEEKTGSAYYEAKAQLEYVARTIGVSLEYRALESYTATSAPLEPKRGAEIWVTGTDKKVGVIGEFTRKVAKAMKLPAYVAGFEIDLELLYEAAPRVAVKYVAPSRYPSVERDVCFQVPRNTLYATVMGTAERAKGKTLSCEITPLDIYEPADREVKNVTLRFTVASSERTLTGEEVSEYMNQIIEKVVVATGGKVI